MTRRSPLLDIGKEYMPREPRLHRMFEYPELTRANHQLYKEITMNATTGEPGYTSLDDVFVKAIKPLKLDEKEQKLFLDFYVTLQQAAPRLCANVLLITVALNDVYHDAGEVMMDGVIVKKYRLTTKRIAHAASIERTLTSKSPYDR